MQIVLVVVGAFLIVAGLLFAFIGLGTEDSSAAAKGVELRAPAWLLLCVLGLGSIVFASVDDPDTTDDLSPTTGRTPTPPTTGRTSTDPPPAGEGGAEETRSVPRLGPVDSFVADLNQARATIVRFYRPSQEGEQGQVIDVEPMNSTPIEPGDVVRIVVSTGKASESLAAMARNGGVYVRVDLSGPFAALTAPELDAAELILFRLFQKLGIPGREMVIAADPPDDDVVEIGVGTAPGPGYRAYRIQTGGGTISLYFEDESVLNAELTPNFDAIQDDLNNGFDIDNEDLEWF